MNFENLNTLFLGGNFITSAKSLVKVNWPLLFTLTIGRNPLQQIDLSRAMMQKVKHYYVYKTSSSEFKTQDFVKV